MCNFFICFFLSIICCFVAFHELKFFVCRSTGERTKVWRERRHNWREGLPKLEIEFWAIFIDLFESFLQHIVEEGSDPDSTFVCVFYCTILPIVVFHGSYEWILFSVHPLFHHRFHEFKIFSLNIPQVWGTEPRDQGGPGEDGGDHSRQAGEQIKDVFFSMMAVVLMFFKFWWKL